MPKKGYSFAIISILLIISNISFSQESVFNMELPFPLNFGINKGFGENSKIWSSGISLGFNPFIKVYEKFYFGIRVSYDKWVPNKEEIYKQEVPKYVEAGLFFLRDTPPSSFVCKGSYEIIGIEQVIKIFLPKIFQTEINTFIQLGAGRYEYESNYYIKLIDSEPSLWSIYLEESKMISKQTDYGLSCGVGASLGKVDDFHIEILPLFKYINKDLQIFSISIGVMLGPKV